MLQKEAITLATRKATIILHPMVIMFNVTRGNPCTQIKATMIAHARHWQQAPMLAKACRLGGLLY